MNLYRITATRKIFCYDENRMINETLTREILADSKDEAGEDFHELIADEENAHIRTINFNTVKIKRLKP